MTDPRPNLVKKRWRTVASEGANETSVRGFFLFLFFFFSFFSFLSVHCFGLGVDQVEGWVGERRRVDFRPPL